MTRPSAMTPRDAVVALVAARGLDWVVTQCVNAATGESVDEDLVRGLVGGHADLILSGREGGIEGYWPRVWALRALLYAWLDRASLAVRDALDDESWRAREMALKVAVRRRVEVDEGSLDRLLADPVERVRAAARRVDVTLHTDS